MSTPPKPIIPVSAPQSSVPLTMEQKRQRFAEIRQRMGRSQIEVTPPAGKTGYWARTSDSREIGRLQWLGYSIVHDDPAKPAWSANGLQTDGTYVIGDCILMEIDTYLYDMLQDEYREMSESQAKNAPRVFKDEAEKVGSPVFEVGHPPRG